MLSKFSERLNKDYLYEILSYKDTQQQFSESAVGGVVQNLNTERVKTTKISLPPLEVQQQIVDECEAIEQSVINAKEAVQDAKQEISIKVSKVIQSSNYEEIKIGNLTETSSGGTPLSSVNEYYAGGTIPWINSGEVSKGEIWVADNFITELGLKNSSAKIFPKETVLLAMYGATAGKVGILKIDACSNQAICGIMPNNRYLSKFLYLQLDSMYEYLLSLRTGIARDNLSQSKIKDIKIKLPPLSIQEKLVSEVEKLEQEISKNQKIVDEAPNFKQQVMKKYL